MLMDEVSKQLDYFSLFLDFLEKDTMSHDVSDKMLGCTKNVNFKNRLPTVLSTSKTLYF